MSTLKSLLTLCGLCLALSLSAQSIAGSWKMSVPAEDGSMMTLVVKMGEDGVYEVDFGGDGSVEITGNYAVADGKVSIQDTGGPNACPGKGEYKLTLSGDQLTFDRISDPCDGRGGPEGKMVFTKM